MGASGAAAHSAGLNMFFSSRHCVGMGDAGPSTPCSSASACALACSTTVPAGTMLGGPGSAPACTRGRQGKSKPWSRACMHTGHQDKCKPWQRACTSVIKADAMLGSIT